jgi:biofilm PGA synthesis protein PgaA
MRTTTAAVCSLLVLAGTPFLVLAQDQDTLSPGTCVDPGVQTHALTVSQLQQQAQRCRDEHLWQQALALYQEGMLRFPGTLHFSVRYAMTLADAGQLEQALVRAGALAVQHRDQPDAFLALSYVQAAARRPYDALAAADSALALAPTTPYVVREYILALSRAGLAHAAYYASREHAALLDGATQRRLQADYLAERVRIAGLSSRTRAESVAMLDQLLHDYEQLIAQWQAAGSQAAADAQRLRVDRLQALHARGRMTDVVQSYEDLKQHGVALPAYVLPYVASAYLAVRQPEKAQTLYALAQQNPALTGREKVDVQLGMFYAQNEAGDTSQARQTIDAVRQDQPVWISMAGNPVRNPNDLRMYTEAPWALAYLYDDDTETAQTELERMTAEAPRNTTLRTSLASVYRARGWPRRAEQELKLAESQEPRSLSVIAGQTQTAMDLNEWQNARTLLEYLQEHAPEDSATKRLSRQWNDHQKAVLYVTAGLDHSRDNPASGDGELKLETVIYSSPINHNWRAFAGAGQFSGDFPEGSIDKRWARAGAQWRVRDTLIEAEASAQNYGGKTRPGVRVSAEFSLNDQWTLGGELAWRSLETPLRALASDISSNQATVFARWHRNERSEWSLTLNASRFSDSNLRRSVSLHGRERVYTQPTYRVDAELDLSASKNSATDRPYFNPRSDFEVLPSVRVSHALYQHYDQRVEHYVQLGAGVYHQQNFGSGAVGLIGYGIRYSEAGKFSIGLSLAGVSRPYDGTRERELRALLDFSLHF